MSRYQSSSTNLALTNFVRTQWQQSAVSLCSSVELTTLAEQLASSCSSVLGGEAGPLRTATRLLADSRLIELTHTAGPDMQTHLAKIRTLLPTGPSTPIAVPDSGRQLTVDEPILADLPAAAAELFTNLVPALARQERGVVADTAFDALDNLGYTVIHESGPNADGIEARRGNEVLLLAVTDGGEISADHLGADGACADRQARFETAMADRGVIMTSRAVDLHDDDVGPLITAAAAAGDASLARAVARHTTSTPRQGAAQVLRAGGDRSRTPRRIRALQQEETR